MGASVSMLIISVANKCAFVESDVSKYFSQLGERSTYESRKPGK